LASGMHWIHGTNAPTPMAILTDTMMNHTKSLILSMVSRKIMTANAVFVHAMAVIVTVARLLRIKMKVIGSSI